jgi:hypothetical protein
MVRRRTDVPVQPDVWDGPIFGQLGVLQTDGERAECHVCGGWYKLLGSHVFQAHGFYARTYRHLFSLRQRTGLAGEELRAQQRRRSGHLASYRETTRQFLLALSPQERSANARQRIVALESLRDPANQARWRQNIAGALARQRVLWRDPAYHDRVARHVSESRGGRVVVACPICKRLFELTRSQARVARRSCGRPSCKHDLRQQIAREVAARAEVRAHLLASSRQRAAWPGREHVECAPAPDWAAVAASDAALVRLFYGLPAGPDEPLSEPLTLTELARTVGLGRRELHARLARTLEQLLGKPIAPPRVRPASTCVVCHGPVIRSSTGESRATCSAACLRTFRAGLAHSTVLRPEARARAAATARQRVATADQREAWRAQIRTARRQARPLLTELEAVDPSRLQLLAPDDLAPLLRYYGLEGQAPHTLNEVARELNVSKFRAAQGIRRAVALLLGPEAVPVELGGRASMPCAVCGRPVGLSPSLAAKAEEHTCGSVCQAELARRRIRRAPLQRDPAVHERARQSIILRKGRPQADAVRALPSSAIDSLPEPRRSLVRAYYGLDGTPVCSYDDLGPRFGLSGARVGDLVRAAVQQLLEQSSHPSHV